jgi:hypothetical protein
MGRRSSSSPWAAFCQRLRRSVEGTFYDFAVQDGINSGRLAPKNTSDVQHARSLCAEHGIVMALDGIPHASALNDRPVLWIDPGRDMAQYKRIAPDSTRWFVQPGCLLGELDAAGLRQFQDLPYHITMAAWLADRSLCDWHAGETSKSGLEHACVLMADGARATLGPFGTNNQKPLEGLALQRLVPALFELSNQPAAQACRKLAHWPSRYRLDALLPVQGQTINLAQLLLGHGGDLGWVEWVVIDERPANEIEVAFTPRFSTKDHALEGEEWIHAGDLDSQIKALFDPSDVFPYPGQDL